MYVELHSRSAFSFLEGSSIPEELIGVCANLGMPAMGLLDRDGLCSCAHIVGGGGSSQSTDECDRHHYYAGLRAGASPEEVLALADADDAPFAHSEELRAWITDGLTQLSLK